MDWSPLAERAVLSSRLSIPASFTNPIASPPTTRCYWVLENGLLAGAYPGNANPEKHRERVAALYGAGMRTFVDLMEENESNNAGDPFVRYDDGLRMLAQQHAQRVAHLRFPIRDGGTTTPDRMRSILDAIDLSLVADRGVYVHCFGGMGRTGTVVCCWLLRHGLASKDNVLTLLTQLRQADTERASWKAPENSTQENFVLGWNE